MSRKNPELIARDVRLRDRGQIVIVRSGVKEVIGIRPDVIRRWIDKGEVDLVEIERLFQQEFKT